MGKRIVISGSIAVDRIMGFSGKYADLIEPSKLDVLSLSVLVDDMVVARGGTGANIAHNLGILGEEPILLGSVGPEADEYIADLHDCGVDVSKVHKSNLPTSSFTVITDSVHSQIGGFYPGAMSDSQSISLETLHSDNPVVCVSPSDPAAMRRLVAECQSYNLRLFYDPGQQVSSMTTEDLDGGIEAAYIVIVNDYELSILCKRLGKSEAELNTSVPIFITTHGKNGSVISGKDIDQPIKIGIALADKVVDPTGAGDAYRAGFLYGFTRDWELSDCAQLGAVMASFILEQTGTQVKVPKDKILSRYSETFSKEVEL